jgi:hypothetical protein
LDYGIDWGAKLTGGDSIVQSDWFAPAGITADNGSVNGSLCIIWLSGGTLGKSYDITNRIVTTAGRQHDLTMRLRIVRR